MKTLNIGLIISKILLLLVTFMNLNEPMGTAFFENETLPYIINNGYRLKTSLIIILLIIIIILQFIKIFKDCHNLDMISILFSGVWLFWMIQDALFVKSNMWN